MDGLFVTNVAHIPNSFHYSHLFQWSSGSSFPRGWHYGFRSGPLFRSSGHPTNAPLCYHPALERSPSTSFSTPSLWKLVDTRDKRCASLCPVFHWFNLFISAATSSVNERQRDRGFQFLCDFAGGRKKMKWRKIDCVENFWQVYIDVIDMVFGGKREKDNIWFRICWMGSISMFFNILLSQKRNWFINFNFKLSIYLYQNLNNC